MCRPAVLVGFVGQERERTRQWVVEKLKTNFTGGY